MDDLNTPKEVLEYMDDDGEAEGARIIRTTYDCPTCGKSYLRFREDRCPRCGQRLKW